MQGPKVDLKLLTQARQRSVLPGTDALSGQSDPLRCKGVPHSVRLEYGSGICRMPSGSTYRLPGAIHRDSSNICST